ncbi:hypothetical protein C8J57DRAFT_1610341 [Mycena rebaudengoi]|nr:hypothetical protein C8J57DRAFT_1610341 [Mycena rebaudengoi]
MTTRRRVQVHEQKRRALASPSFSAHPQWNLRHLVLLTLLSTPSRGLTRFSERSVVDGHNLFLVIATGKGKTIILHAPLIAAQARKERGIAFLIVPTKVLAEQQAEVAQKNGLRALAINEDSVREAGLQKRDLFAEFAGGDSISVVVMSPQMLRSPRVNKLLSNQTFKFAVRWMLIDEAHVIDESEGTDARKSHCPSLTRWSLNNQRQGVAPDVPFHSEETKAGLQTALGGFQSAKNGRNGPF